MYLIDIVYVWFYKYSRSLNALASIIMTSDLVCLTKDVHNKQFCKANLVIAQTWHKSFKTVALHTKKGRIQTLS